MMRNKCMRDKGRELGRMRTERTGENTWGEGEGDRTFDATRITFFIHVEKLKRF